MKNILKPLAKSVLIQLQLIVAASATDAAIHKKMFRSGMTILIILNEEMNDIMKVVKTLEESGLLNKRRQQKKNKTKAKEQKGGFLCVLLGTLGAILLGNLLTGKGVMLAGEDTIRVD